MSSSSSRVGQSASFENWEGLFGVAWAPGGEELYFGGLPLGMGQEPSLWAVSLGGVVRLLHAGTGLHVDDIARDGRALVRELRFSLELGVMSLVQRTGNPHMGWFDEPLLSALSVDGRSMLVQEANAAGVAFGAINGGGAYWTFLQPMDGSPPVRLGPGRAVDLSPDGKWALALDQTGHPGRIWLLPTGSGTSRSVDVADLRFVADVGWFGFFLPDARQAVLPVQGTDGVRAYVVDLQTGQSRARTPPLLAGAASSPDRRFLAAASVDGGVNRYSTEKSAPSAVRGVGPNDVLLAWTNRGLLVSPDARPPVRMFRVDPETGARELFTTLGTGDAPGADAILSLAVTPDEKTMAYSYSRRTARLCLYDFRADAAPPGRER